MPHLDSRRYLLDIISNIFLPSPFEGNLGTDNAHEDTNFILCLVDLVVTPAGIRKRGFC